MMAVVQWSEALSVGDVQIDADHQQLFDFLDQLRLAVRRGQDAAVLTGILAELVRSTEAHFRLEEQLMQRCAYPGMSAHKSEHDKLFAQVRELQIKVESGSLPLSLSVFQFLYGWLARHIETRDKELGAFMAARHA